MSREELEKLKVDDLAKICKERNIPHYRGKNLLKKGEMVDAILKEQLQPEVVPVVEKKIECDAGSVAKEKETEDIKQLPGTKEYLKNINVGTLVAFKEDSGRLNTAAVQNVSFKRSQLRLVTQYGKEFIVPFENVIWVRTSARWPKFILDALKSQQRKGRQYATAK